MVPSTMPLSTTATITTLACTACVAVWLLRARLRASFFGWLQDGLDEVTWSRLPRRIIFLRHGEAEHNLEGGAILQEENPDRKPDNLSELTDRGRSQARKAGAHIRKLLGDDAVISVVVSPFERTLQTLYSLQRTLGGIRVRQVHVDPRVREQEFGNFQEADKMSVHRERAQEVGRFYYRRPTGESGADVFDRAASFWDDLLRGCHAPAASFARGGTGAADPPCTDDALLVVTHGLSMRLLMMRYYNWSPQTFDAVYNPGNADMWVLAKDDEQRRYVFEPSSSSPPSVPWATRQVRLVRRLKDASGHPMEVEEDYTLVDYLALPQPRTSHPTEAMKQLIPGHSHRLDPSKLEWPEERAEFIEATRARCVPPPTHVVRIDWWCGKISPRGVALRSDSRSRRASLVVPASSGAAEGDPVESEESPSARRDSKRDEPTLDSILDSTRDSARDE